MTIVIFSVTVFLIILYLLYPLWLLSVTRPIINDEETEGVECVSLILLTCNGRKYLKDKIEFLIKELSSFKCYEMIIIDDNSTDGSAGVLENYKSKDNIRIFFKNGQTGIPDSMNFGVLNSKYDYIIFCDQRQELSEGILKKLVEPLKFKNTGAVSGCILSHGKGNRFSFIRKHENFLKTIESKSGNLMGVYGPLYSIKKKCYPVIPDNIILDDLYLSLRILKTMNIEIKENCRITDDDFSILYDYKRVKRYLNGFFQLLNEKSIISDLNLKQRTMLIWHKYLRLLIPFFIFLSYLCTGFLITRGTEYVILFSSLTIAGIISVLPVKSGFLPKNIIRMNILYFVGLIEVSLKNLFKEKSE